MPAPILSVLGELVVGMLPEPSVGADPGTDPPTRAELDAARAAR